MNAKKHINPPCCSNCDSSIDGHPYVEQLESKNKELIKFANEGLSPLEWKDLENVNKLKSLVATEQEENKGLKVQMRALQDSINELIEENNNFKLIFYSKLIKKLELVSEGKLKLVPYMIDIAKKIETLENQ
ncbi:hypothetical protein KAR91_56230 [Candidatus Pacearchaeota archaeon]|nr:hypothetical protein [Candidatus Pacearchaeota archaeon]